MPFWSEKFKRHCKTLLYTSICLSVLTHASYATPIFINTFGIIGTGTGSGHFSESDTLDVAINESSGHLLVIDLTDQQVYIFFDPALWTLPGTSILNNLSLNQSLTLNNGFNFTVENLTELASGGILILEEGGIFNTKSLVLNDGTLSDNANTTLTSPTLITNNGHLISSANNTLTFTGQMSGEGGLITQGMGTIVFSGRNTFAGPTIVSQGRLSINGTHAGPVNIQSGATLGGIGTILNTITNNGGILSPGNSIGTMVANGYISQSDNSIFNIEIDPAGQSSLLQVIGIPGTATLAGTLNIVPDPGTYTSGIVYNILSATGGVTGTFAKVTFANGNLGNLRTKVIYNPNLVQFALLPAGIPLIGDQSDVNIAIAIDSILNDPTLQNSTLVTQLLNPLENLPANQTLISALDQLTQQKSLAVETSMITAVNSSFDAIQRLSAYLQADGLGENHSMLGALPASNGYMAGDTVNCLTNFGVTFFGDSERQRQRNPFIFPFKSKMGGVGALLQTAMTDHYIVGAGLGYVNIRNKIHNLGASAEDPTKINSYQGMLINGYSWDTVYIELDAMYARNDVHQQRQITFPTVNMLWTSKYRVDQYALQGTATKAIPLCVCDITLAPQVSLTWDQLKRKAFQDRDFPGAERHARFTTYSTVAGLGLSLLKNQYDFQDEILAVYESHYNYYRELHRKGGTQINTFVAGGPAFAIVNYRFLPNTQNVGASITTMFLKNLNISAFYDAYFRKRYINQAVNLKVTWDF